MEGKAVIISWITADEPGSSMVLYWTENSKLTNCAKGRISTYKYYNYTSGYIHYCKIKRLEYHTKYYYEVGVGNTTRQFWFVTPPKVGPHIPYAFGFIGNLGQMYGSNKAVHHYEENPTKGHTVLFVRDLSCADDYPDHNIKLFTEDPNQRLGAGGASELKQHPFYRDINWDTLARQKAAFVPFSDSALDTSYFTSRYSWNTLEEHVFATSEFEDSSDNGSMSGSSSPRNRHDELVAR